MSLPSSPVQFKQSEDQMKLEDSWYCCCRGSCCRKITKQERYTATTTSAPTQAWTRGPVTPPLPLPFHHSCSSFIVNGARFTIPSVVNIKRWRRIFIVHIAARDHREVQSRKPCSIVHKIVENNILSCEAEKNQTNGKHGRARVLWARLLVYPWWEEVRIPQQRNTVMQVISGIYVYPSYSPLNNYRHLETR